MHCEAQNETDLKLVDGELQREDDVFREDSQSDELISDNETSKFGDGPDGDVIDDDESNPDFQEEEDKSDSGKWGGTD